MERVDEAEEDLHGGDDKNEETKEGGGLQEWVIYGCLFIIVVIGLYNIDDFDYVTIKRDKFNY
jgi:hypothetical protein